MAEPSPTLTAEEIPHLEEERLLDLGIQPNQLDQFDQPTYHFRLYMMSDEASRTRRFGPSSREERIVIAESGVTSTAIDNVEISSVTGMSKGTGVGISTNFSFTLTQPFGATLLDEIVNAAQLLGIQNYSKAPYYLELSFKGRSRDDTSREADSDFNNLIWVWPIIFTKMSIDVNVGGSIYAVEGSLYSDVAYTNHVADIDKTISVDAETVGEFYIGLAAALNQREAEKVDTGYVFPDTFSFKVDADLFNERIVPPASEDRQNRAATFEKVDGKMRITFTPPIDIDKITQNILSLTDYFQTKAKGTDKADEQKKANQGEDAIFQTLYRVVADSEMGKYDPGRQDYQRHHRYMIIPYTMSTIQTQSNTESNVSSEKRFEAIYKRGLLTKQYDYLYTGLNDQVLDFEIVFNFNWYAALPLQGGRYTVSNTEVSAAKTDTQKQLQAGVYNSADAAQAINDRIVAEFPSSLATFTGWSFEDFIKGLVPQQVTDLQEQVEENINAVQLAASDIMGQVTDQIDTITATAGGAIENVQAGMPDAPEFIAGLPPITIIPSLPTGGIGLSTGVTAATTAKATAWFQSKTNFPRVTDYSSSTAAASQQNLIAQDYKLEDQTRGEDDVPLFHTTYIESTPSKSQGGTGAYSSTPGQNMLSALFEQANTPLSADLLDITLKIKGDPYWLEPDPIGRNDTPLTKFDRAAADRETQNDNTRGDRTTFNGVNTTSQQTYFVFRNFTPQQFDAESGITPKNNKDRNMLSGVYGVKTVQHSFSGGQFTQELHAIRDPRLNLQGIDLDNPLGAASDAPDTEAIAAIDTTFVDPFASDDVNTFFGIGDTTLGTSAVENNSLAASDLFGKLGDGGGT